MFQRFSLCQFCSKLMAMSVNEKREGQSLKPIELSVLDLVPVLQGADANTAIQQSVRLAQTAEKLGYKRYWVSEHHDMPLLASACPEVLLAHIGAHTHKIRIGSGAVLLPHYKPLKVAEAFHLLATLYPGRIDLGIGRAPGGSAHVSMALSDNFLESIRRMPESIGSLSSLLANQYQIDGQPVLARPIPEIPPELWLLGTNNKSAQYAAQYGTGYVFGQFMSDKDGDEVLSTYRNEFRASHFSDQPNTMVAVGIVCAETEDEARALSREAMSAFAGPFESVEPSANRKRVLAGNPQQIKEQLELLRQQYGVSEFIVVTMAKDYEARLRSYELLAQTMLH
jgi:luciferase family oxidoreductase group 1